GLLDAAVARPQATVFGVDAYPQVWDKAAALLQSLARNHALVDRNKRTAWAAAWTFLCHELTLRRTTDTLRLRWRRTFCSFRRRHRSLNARHVAGATG
ncbi:MAG: Fic family protein, partial [Mycobacterium sp.]